METLENVGMYANLVLFAGLAIVSLRHWRRQRAQAAFWVMLTFGVLSFVTILSPFLQEDETSVLETIGEKALIGVLLLFPYFFYRFQAALKPMPRLFDVYALLSTGIVIAWGLSLPELPADGEPQSDSFKIFTLIVLVQWTSLLLISSIRLWLAGRGEMTIVRRRVRLLAFGMIGLNVAVIIGGGSGEETSWVDIAVNGLTVLSALAFYLAFVPPSFLRAAWRRSEDQALQRAVTDLITATSTEQITSGLLPHVAAMFGARGVALIDREAGVIGSYGDVAPALTAIREERSRDDTLRLEFPFGEVVVLTGPFAPFFGRDEVALLGRLGVMATLSLQRAELFDQERQIRQMLERANVDLAEAQAIAHLGSWDWDLRTGRITWSDELFRIYGLEPRKGALEREFANDMTLEDDREAVRSATEAAIAEKRGFEYEYRIRRADGQIRRIIGRGRSIVENDEVARMIGTAQDVTEAREAEELAHRLADAQARQAQALELNDNIVQGLTVAKYALDLDDIDQTRAALDRTLKAARSIISDLLRGTGGEPLGPGDLVRARAATLSNEDEV